MTHEDLTLVLGGTGKTERWARDVTTYAGDAATTTTTGIWTRKDAE
jgi:hypothetical protein